ncbi:MAG: hypothetical protein JKY55_05995 [Aliivibrio sp.]|uniref:hypothetical protein n=1 Tax=Aliivibrio sp. TaxID=1872443 RepID=UPI001A384351|nr:hypothetical protein [Aliivibrio sp.]
MALSVCAQITNDGVITILPSEPLTNCSFTVLSHSDYLLMMNNANLYFDIDAAFYTQIIGYLLLSFLSGHILGRILKGLGRG